MRKILCLILVFLVVTGCKNDNDKKEEIKLSYKEKKSYYVSLVNQVSHDDYYKTVSKSDETTKPTTKYTTKPVPTYNANETISYSAPLVEEDASLSDVNAALKDTSLNEASDLVNNDNNVKEEEKADVTTQEIPNDVKSEDLSLTSKEDDVSSTTNISDESLEDETLLEIGEHVNNNNNKTNSTSGYYSPSGKYLGEQGVKVIDVSYYQGDINWDLFASESDCYGVILRLGYYDTLDKKFERNINEIKRLNIPYGIYLFSYSTTLTGAKKEALFTNQMIDKYDLNPTLGIYYDIESWSSSNGSSSNEISKDMYDKIISTYINEVSNHVDNNYKVKVYSGRWYAMNRLGNLSKSYVDWVAEYNSTCKYDGPYSMWQYTSKGRVPGIEGNVDVSYIL